ncbi:uncharacterized protein LOC130920612 [Corythoichthys intestinalis]|uniref:uncharacterized protein LOC130920612 n=1 Tax=Corythoichthys intestinalis TaxID=161448 RepID=UPI0025A64155|nr:uncharacterized protein LOC130920612 [Corythoichthys intestinalis]XP_057699930.1 uncharacterized protein LOC130920612 [Corythoichthys intestinalis]XP_057699931.1 uncharacterized protein LOC130920612 [Corythoichthys intestinalis]XP_057699932.1 uncharacterized protein LOC130920612 [Corythoichthys intestinalis]
MIFVRLLYAYILAELSISTKALMSVNNVTAECNKQVAIHCNVLPGAREELSVKHISWSRNHEPLCQVDKGNLKHSINTKSDFHCEFKEGRLSLILEKVQPVDSGASNRYMCKLHSNQGISHGYSWIELQECCGMVKSTLSRDSSMCTFSHVYPDAEVFWSYDSQNQSEGFVRHKIYKSVEEGGWLTIKGQLEGSSNGSFNCSLRSIVSGRHIVCNSSEDTDFQDWSGLETLGFTPQVRDGAESLKPLWSIFLMSIIVVFMEK